MLTQLVLFLIISVGSIFAITLNKNIKYEEILPITCTIIVAVLFLFGLCNKLYYGVWFILIISVLLYLTSFVIVLKRKDSKEFFKRVFSIGFICFSVLFLSFSIFNESRVPYTWDEFSHWADIVKVMYSLNDFATNPLSNSMFPDYPPGMALFQYFYQIVLNIVDSQMGYCEWRLYHAYQIFFFSFLFPIFAKFDNKKIKESLLSFVVLLVFPTLFFDIYKSIYIDPFLGMMFGVGIVVSLKEKKNKVVYLMTTSSIIFTLVLSKAVGLLFAISLLIVVVTTLFAEYGKKKNTICCSMVPVVALIVPKLFWKIELLKSNIYDRSSISINPKEVLEIFVNKNETYRQHTFNDYFRQLFISGIGIGKTGVTVGYLVLLIVFLFLLYCLVNKYYMSAKNNNTKVIIKIVFATSILYYFATSFLYIQYFEEYESQKLASMDRYLSVVLLSLWTVLILLFIDKIISSVKVKHLGVYTIVTLMIICPMNSIYDFASWSYAKASIQNKENYEIIIDKVLDETENSKVYIISQASDGYDYWFIKYNIRTNKVNDNLTWSIGETFFDGDAWTIEITPSQWQKELVESFDYVALYRINDYFIANYSCLFENPDNITNDQLYKVNKETGMLELVS